MAQWAIGTLLKMGDGGAPESFTTVAEITNINGPSMSANTIDVTSHDSTDGWSEKIPGMLDGGDLTLDLNFVPTDPTHDSSTGLLAAFKNRTKANWQLIFPDEAGTTWTFPAYVTKFAVTAPVNNKLGASVTLSMASKPTI